MPDNATPLCTVLVVDDDRGIVRTIGRILSRHGMQMQSAENLEQALQQLALTSFDLILLDLVLPNVSGADGVRKVRALCPDTPVIVISGQGKIDIAVECMRAGALDFIRKPFPPSDAFASRIQAAIVCRPASDGSRARPVPMMQRRGTIVFTSSAMKEVMDAADLAAATELPVLVLGETGTGKELIAHHVHDNGERHQAPFVPVNCGALTDALVESELFGHAKGAFTGAHAARAGLLQAADRGTLFLDEVGELPRESQAKLLRALQDGEVRAVGESRTRHVDIRIVAASNRDLDNMVASGEFRADLYHRLAGHVVRIPPLRSRTTDIGVLVRHFLDTDSAAASAKQLLPETLDTLNQHTWPGNVRELRNAVGFAAVASQSTVIQPRDLPAGVRVCSVPQYNPLS